ncbi:MAG: protoporphyrinogen oxidase [Deltaproteobacteria bacterium]|nr:protoporphyrinogen oxidase [Deltaproteobacteria bacterium]
MPCDAIVVGGGIAGLCAAFELGRKGRDVLLFESENEAGGNVRTAARDGFLLERGPHAFLGSADQLFALVDGLGIGDRLAPARPAAARRYIVRDGVPREVPGGPWSFLTTGLLGPCAKLRLAAEPLFTGRGSPDDTASTFFARRFGREAARILAGAFVNGVYAGDPDRLSAPAAFPLFWRFEQEHGGMIRGGMAHARARRRQHRLAGTPLHRGLFSFEGGLGTLTRALAGHLGPRCRMGSRVTAVVPRRDGPGYAVSVSGETHAARAVIVAAPPAAASDLVSGLDRDLAKTLAGFRMAPVATVQLGYGKRLSSVPEAFGALAPAGHGTRALGVLFPSRIFGDRTPPDGDLLNVFLGGVNDAAALDLDDAALTDLATGEVRKLFGVDAPCDFAQVDRYPAAIPQLELGHLDRMAGIEARLAARPGLRLAGNYLTGVGIKDAVASGFAAATRIDSFLSGGGA